MSLNRLPDLNASHENLRSFSQTSKHDILTGKDAVFATLLLTPPTSPERRVCSARSLNQAEKTSVERLGGDKASWGHITANKVLKPLLIPLPTLAGCHVGKRPPLAGLWTPPPSPQKSDELGHDGRC